MGENSSIEWCDHSFNCWLGCTKVSPGCANCYAEYQLAIRFGSVKWGKGAKRVRTSEEYWEKPLRWNRKAEKEGTRPRVFCASLADVFDPEVPDEWRRDLFALICKTPFLDWLLLTKRPELIGPYSWIMPPNVWLGVSVENQAAAMKRIPLLLGIEAKVRFLSCEPLLGRVDLRHVRIEGPKNLEIDCLAGSYDAGYGRNNNGNLKKVDWVIVGGESGPHARPMHPDWARLVRDQCEETHVPFLFKQWGEHIVPYDGEPACRVCGCTEQSACEGGCGWAEEDLCDLCQG